MEFKTDEMHADLIAMYRDFAENSVKPIAAELDKEERYPEENVKLMAELGVLGIPFPEEYGGTGMDNLSYAQCVEELSKVCASTGVIVSAHTSLCSWPIYHFGTEEQKQKYLVPLATGEKLGAFGLTEANAGTDAAGLFPISRSPTELPRMRQPSVSTKSCRPAEASFSNKDKEQNGSKNC